nr:hypothetical protein [Desulfobacterales bacterium]
FLEAVRQPSLIAMEVGRRFRTRIRKLPRDLQTVLKQDLETALENRLRVLERRIADA